MTNAEKEGKRMEQTAKQVAERVLARLGVEIEASGRHVHLSRRDLEALFGPGAELTPVRPLSQPGQFVCAQRVTVAGPKGELHSVVVLGPERKESQVEISLTDGVALGVAPPVRQSGDVAGSAPVTLIHGDRRVELPHGLIAALRHVHMTPEDAALQGLRDGQVVRLKCFTARPLIFDDVVVRVSDRFATYAHIDYDEANACGFQKGDRGLILS